MLVRIKAFIVRIVVRVGHKAEHAFHMTYLGLVSIEAHGKYRYAALALLVVIVINALTGDIEE